MSVVPSNVTNWTNKTDNVDDIMAAHVNDLYTGVNALDVANATAKATPVDADSIGVVDSASDPVGIVKKTTWTNIKAFLKTYFDTLYNNYAHPSDGGGSIPTALTGANVVSAITVNTLGHVTGTGTRALTAANVGAAATSHNLVDTTNHPVTGLTTGHVIRASGATAYAFAQLAHADLATISADQHHAQNHALINTTGHTASGLTSGHFLKATAATTYAFGAHGLAAADVGAEPTLTKGNLTASGSVAVSGARQVIGGAAAITHLTTDGNLHVPATSTTNNGRVLTAGATAGSLSWVAPVSGRQIYSGDDTEKTHYGATLTTIKTLRIAKSSANGVNVTKLSCVLEGNVSGGTGTFEIWAGGSLLFTLPTTTSTSYVVLQGNSAVSWTDNTITEVLLRVKSSGSFWTRCRLWDMYVE